MWVYHFGICTHGFNHIHQKSFQNLLLSSKISRLESNNTEIIKNLKWRQVWDIFLKDWTILVQNLYFMSFVNYFWSIGLFGTKFVLCELWDIFRTVSDLTILVQNLYFMTFVTYFSNTGLFWYKIRTVWILRRTPDGLDYHCTKFVLYEYWDKLLTD